MSDTWQMNYDEAASHWLEKDRDAVHMEPAALREKIDAFLRAYNTGALATAGGNLVRCTPIEYNYVDGCLYLLSEGGLKFKCLKDNKRVGFAIFEPYGGFGQLKSLQITGTAKIVEPFSKEYHKLLDHKKIPADAIRKLPNPMNLIKIVPEAFDYCN